MPRRDHYAQGVPAWADLATPDFEGAKRFYSTLFGWDCQDQAGEGGPYSLAMQKGEAAAGIYQAQGDMASVWTTYIAVDDTDDAAERIRGAGGRILMEPTDVEDAGRMAIASDPGGAIFAIWESANHIGATIVNEHGAMNWNELTTDGIPGALDFYREIFGYETEVTKTPGGRDYHMFKVGGRAIAGALEPPAPGISNNWGVYFAVDDAAKAEQVAKENGGRVVYGPIESPDVGTFLGIADPYGAHLTLIQLAGPVD
jgi:predicted enzyme related to lactoylglutathione lyase